MNTKVEQTDANLSYRYRIQRNSNSLFNVTMIRSSSNYRFAFMKDEKEVYSLKVASYKAVKEMMTPKEYRLLVGRPFEFYNEHNEIIGHISSRITKFFIGYKYFEMELNHQKYLIYEVGLGKNGIKIPIYLEGSQVALIEKSVTVNDNKDTYDIFTRNENDAFVASVFSIYYDIIRFGNLGEVVNKTKENTYFYTMNKELKRKYDPDFKSVCIE